MDREPVSSSHLKQTTQWHYKQLLVFRSVLIHTVLLIVCFSWVDSRDLWTSKPLLSLVSCAHGVSFTLFRAPSFLTPGVIFKVALWCCSAFLKLVLSVPFFLLSILCSVALAVCCHLQYSRVLFTENLLKTQPGATSCCCWDDALPAETGSWGRCHGFGSLSSETLSLKFFLV